MGFSVPGKAILSRISWTAKWQARHQRIRPVFHFESFVTFNEWDRVVALVDECGIDSLFIYPDEFREHDEPEKELKAYAKAVSFLRSKGIRPYALHGGYYAIAMSKAGLEGFGNGVGYSEARSSSYHKGGTADRRIYIPRLHRFLEPAAAQDVVLRMPEYFASDSRLLSSVCQSNRPFTDISLEEALDHFMECREQEMALVSELSGPAIAGLLSETVDVLKRVRAEQFGYGVSLARWAAVIQTL